MSALGRLREIGSRNAVGVLDPRRQVERWTTLAGDDLGDAGRRDVQGAGGLCPADLALFQLSGELFWTGGVSHALNDSESLTDCKRKVNASGNFSLSRAVAMSYGRLTPVTSPADRLRRNVQRLLKQHGVTQADLARYVGRSRPWISQILSGRRATTMATLGKIAEFFPGADVEDLFLKSAGTSTVVPDQVTPGDVSSSGPTLVSKVVIDAASLNALRQQLIELQTKHDKLLQDIAGAVEYFSSITGQQIRKAPKREARTRRVRGTPNR